MKLQGTVCSTGFCIADTSYSRLCDALAKLPEVRFIDRRNFFWFSDGIQAEFIFRSYTFRVQPDPWDKNWWIVPSGLCWGIAELRALHEQLFILAPAA